MPPGTSSLLAWRCLRAYFKNRYPGSDNRNINALKQPLLRDSKPYRIRQRGPRPEPAASGMANNYVHPLLRAAMSREHIRSNLRAIDSHIGKVERLLLAMRRRSMSERPRRSMA